MEIPDRKRAEAYLQEAESLNPGQWVPHSRNVARAAGLFAGRLPDVDPETASILGLLHDIGRREAATGMRHTYDGFIFLKEQGYPDAARICLTHPFPYKDIRAGSSRWDASPAEMQEISTYLENIVFNDYDRLIQLCDSLALPQGFCLMEKRWVDVVLRYKNINAFTVRKWEACFDIKKDFEERIGESIYNLLPDVVENTFS